MYTVKSHDFLEYVMRFQVLICALATILLALTSACSIDNNNPLDNLDPHKTTEKELQKLDKEYEAETGMKSHIPVEEGACYQINCPVFALVDKESQTLSLYIDGDLEYVWQISSGLENGYETPDFDKRPDGRIYDAYTSRRFPGGNFEGLGNMPYAVFIGGGYAIHGTGRGNWKKLGKKASHGCIRLHPDNAKIFNELVRSAGIENVWITVQ